MRLDRGGRHAVLRQARPQPVRISRQDVRSGISFDERRMVPGPLALLPIRQFQCRRECQMMMAGQYGQRREPLWAPVRELPGKAGTSVVSNQKNRDTPNPCSMRTSGASSLPPADTSNTMPDAVSTLRVSNIASEFRTRRVNPERHHQRNGRSMRVPLGDGAIG
jgi:hypothetical protein